MKAWKYIRFGLMIALCVLLNLGGKVLAVRYELPLWLDSFGTVMCAYAAGPVIGAIVGVTSNMIYNMFEPMAWIYALTSIALAFVVGVAAKRQALKTLFGTMTASAWAAAIAIVISLPLNILFTGGSTGNLWGDGVIAYLRDHGWPIMLCDAIGQFYIELQGCHLGCVGEIDWHGDNLSAHSAHVLYTKFVDILSLHIGEAQHA